MHSNLEKHDNIWMPDFEPVHFCTDLNYNSNYKNAEDYSKIFSKYRDLDGFITGEKTSNYICSNFAMEAIHKNNKNTKIIITIRNPVDAIISYHNHNVRMGYEKIVSIEDAILAQNKRKNSNYKIPYFAKKEKGRFFIMIFFITLKR